MVSRKREKHLEYVALVHRMRTLGSGLGALPVASVLYQQNASRWLWALVILHAVIWPHVAWVIASRAENPARAERRNFLVDTILVGIWVPVMQLNLLPSAVLVTMLAMNHVSAGGWRLLARSLLLLSLTGLATWWMLGFTLQPVSTMFNIVACLPMLLSNPIWLSKVNYSLAQRVRQQNRLLDQLNRTDALTGLPNRTHWLEAVSRALQQFERNRRPATVILLDIDNFKNINDSHGHAAGDALLRKMASVLYENLREVDTPGRLGGDEFGIVLSDTDDAHAHAVAERIRQQIERSHIGAHSEEHAWTVSLASPKSRPP
ncbi:MAG: diguanylate cyclase [Rhodanobacter sp.]|nr:MAG: diguanylate cyclase [Rhodanobacter sp.]